MNNKSFLKSICLMLIVSVCLCFSGCGGDKETESETERATLKVAMLGKDIKSACVIMAKELGYFEEENLNVQFEKVNSLPDGLTAVSMDKLDILPYGIIPSCSFISQGTDVVIFGGTISEGSEGITAGNEKYTELLQFEGKKIACFRMETGHMVLKDLLREAGVDAEFIYMDSQQSIVEAVNKGETDIGIVNSGYGYVAEQGGASVAFHVSDFRADFPCCRQTASRTAVTEKRAELVRYMKAVLRAYDTYVNDRDTTISTLTAYSGQDDAYVEAIMYGTEDYDNAMIVSLDPNKKKVSEFYEIMKANGDISADTEYDINDYIDISIYEEALQELIDEGANDSLYRGLMEQFEVNNK